VCEPLARDRDSPPMDRPTFSTDAYRPKPNARSSGQWLGSDLTGRLSAAKKVFSHIASGRYDDVIDVKRSDEAGSVLLGLKMMQIRLGVHVEALQTRAEEMERIRQGLDAAATALLLTDADLRITYANRALLQLFEHASGELQEIWPELRADAVVGASIQNLRVVDGSADDRSRFFKDIQRTSFSELKAGSRIFSLIVTPVNLDSGPRLGYVVEWRDRTDAVEVEREINAIVSAAAECQAQRGQRRSRANWQVRPSRSPNAAAAPSKMW